MSEICKSAVLLWLLFNAFNHSAQKYYVGIDGGYNFPLAAQNISSNTTMGPDQTSYAVVKGSFGQGISGGLTGGYIISPNLSFEIGASYLQSPTFSAYFVKDTVSSHSIKISANMLRLTPGFKISTGDKKVRIYLRMGVIFRLAGKSILKNEFIDFSNNSTTYSEWKYFKGFSIGAYSSAGLSYLLSNKITLFFEVLANIQSWAPKYGDVIKYSIDGTDMVETLNPSQKHIHFSDQYTVSNSTYTNWEPSEQLKQYYSFNSLGLKIGLIFYFNNGIKTTNE